MSAPNTARSVAKAHRAGTPADRRRIESRITREDRWGEFAYSRDGELICKLGKADWQRIVASGGGAYGKRDPLQLTDAQREIAGVGVPVRFTKLVGGFVCDADDLAVAA